MGKQILLGVLVILLFACKKDKQEEVCPGGCGEIEFNTIDFDPTYSPDGKYIAYCHSYKNTTTGIYLITPDGKENRLWHKSIGASSPSWSPDGQWITFSEGGQIWKKKVNGEGLTAITTEGRSFFPSWSPDGKWIVYDSNLETPNGMNFIWKSEAENLNKQRIAYDLANGEIRMPSWSKSDKIVHIRYVNDKTGVPEIFIMDSNGSNVKRLTNNNTNREGYPKYSIKDKILYNSKPLNALPSLWVMDSDGKNQWQVVKHQSYNADWSPNGNQIVYTDARKENGRLWIVNADGSNPKQLTFDTQGLHVLANQKLTADIMSKTKGTGFPTYILIKKDGEKPFVQTN